MEKILVEQKIIVDVVELLNDMQISNTYFLNVSKTIVDKLKKILDKFDKENSYKG